MEKHEFDIRMKTKDMFAFMLRQQYFGLRGRVFLVFITTAVVFSVIKWDSMEGSAKAIIIFVVFIFLVFAPLQLFLRSKLQAGSAERFQLATHYVINEEGIIISQAGEELELKWGHLFKYVKSGSRLYVFTTAVSAIIFPKDQIEDADYNYLLEQLAAHKSEFLTLSIETAVHRMPESEENNKEE